MADFIALGGYTKDTIVRRSGVSHVHGGGYTYAAHAAVLTGLRVAAVTRLAAEDRVAVEPLAAIGVDVRVLPSARSTLMRLEYPNDDPDQRTLSVEAVVDPFTPADLDGLDARAVLVTASIRGEAPLSVLDAVKAKGAILGVDVQGFVRVVGAGGRLEHRPWPEEGEALALVDVLKADIVEAAFLTGTSDLGEAARRLAAKGPTEIVLTHKDGVLVLAEGRVFEAAFRPDAMRGRSGRGDTCVGSYMSRRLQAGPEDATAWAGAVTSLKLEAEGPIRRPRADVLARLAATAA